MESFVLAVFALVYLGMILGGIPGLALDRTGIALLGALALVAGGALSPAAAWTAIDVPTIALLFGMMILSAQLSTSGFYARITDRIAHLDVRPATLLFAVIVAAGVLSAVLVNDVVCLAMAPLLVDGCARRKLDPVPFLLGLAAGSNVGSAATLIGNPQNMLVGQTLGLSFGGYLVDALVPSALGLGVVQLVIVLSVRGRWTRAGAVPAVERVPYDAWTTWKALVATAVLVAAFLAAPWPREVVALAVAGVLLVNRRTESRAILARVDGQLLVLFMGLFVVNRALADTGRLAAFVAMLSEHGVDLREPGQLFLWCVPLSNVVSNVPAVMLLLPQATHPSAGAALALASTLAGNLVLVGSIANLIVVDQAARRGVTIGWREHARVGVPIALLTLGIAAAWLWLRSVA
ncbi:MAG: anion transporter [Planctomycetes bacterium]|nr:anion transporter [Planctomycetota bacterium]